MQAESRRAKLREAPDIKKFVVGFGDVRSPDQLLGQGKRLESCEMMARNVCKKGLREESQDLASSQEEWHKYFERLADLIGKHLFNEVEICIMTEFTRGEGMGMMRTFGLATRAVFSPKVNFWFGYSLAPGVDASAEELAFPFELLLNESR